MRLVELGKFYPPERGGIETLLGLFCEGFVHRGARVDCVVANRQAKTVTEDVGGVRVHRLASLGEVFSVSLVPGYPGFARRLEADVWHAHFPNPLADLAILRAPRHLPVVVTWHSDIVRQKAALWLYAPVIRAVLDRADRVVVATPHHIEYSNWLPRWRDKTAVIPFGLNLGRFRRTDAMDDKVARLRGESGGKPILLNVGRLVGYKGQRHAIEALRGLDAQLWLVGTGPLEGELRKLAAENGVAGRVRFLGDVGDADLPAIYHACDVFVFPSVSPNEAFGLAQVEAMACGKPVVACNLRSGVPYVCLNDETGLIVRPGDSEALSTAIRRILSSEALRLRLGEAGRRRAWAEFADGVMVERYWGLFEELMDQSQRV